MTRAPMLALPHRSVRPALFVVGAGLLAYVGCSSGGSSTISVTHPTMIEVAPEIFLGNVPCSTNGPGLTRFVATLYDLNGADAVGGAPPDDRDSALKEELQGGVPSEQFQLPSSPPTPCGRAVGFGYVVPGRHYQVRIDGYDREVTARALGSREMTDSSTGKLATAPWRASCYRAVAVDSTVVSASLCDPFVTRDLVSTGSVRVPLANLLGDLQCGEGAGQVDHFEIALVGAIDTQTVPCSADAEAVFTERKPGTARASVSAFAKGSTEPFAATNCDANVVADAQADARCSRLTTQGTLQIDVQSLLGELGLSCSTASVRAISVDVTGAGDAVDVSPPGCLQPFQQGVPAGDNKTATVQVTPAKGEALQVKCHADQVGPAQMAVAKCDPPL